MVRGIDRIPDAPPCSAPTSLPYPLRRDVDIRGEVKLASGAAYSGSQNE